MSGYGTPWSMRDEALNVTCTRCRIANVEPFDRGLRTRMFVPRAVPARPRLNPAWVGHRIHQGRRWRWRDRRRTTTRPVRAKCPARMRRASERRPCAHRVHRVPEPRRDQQRNLPSLEPFLIARESRSCAAELAELPSVRRAFWAAAAPRAPRERRCGSGPSPPCTRVETRRGTSTTEAFPTGSF
jgi:hypothetical protein